MKSGKKTTNNSSSKKSKYKNIQMIKHATDYLSNITLSAHHDDVNTKKNYFDKIISNEFDCFLTFNKINTKPDKQTEYFNYYKQKLLNENPNSDRLNYFLENEFNQFESLNKNDSNVSLEKLYIDYLLSNSSSKLNNANQSLSPDNLNLNIPSITIVPSSTFGNSAELNSNINTNNINKASMSDAETDYLRKHSENLLDSNLAASNATLSSSSSSSIHLNNSNHKFAHTISSALHSISHPIHKLQKLGAKASLDSNNEHGNTNFDFQTAESVTQLNSSGHLAPISNRKSHKLSRTISESSNESNNTVNSGNIGARNYSTVTGANSKTYHHKLSLFNNLKRLTNEKLILTSNNSPIGIFSRLPFRLNSLKAELNESFMGSKTRHLSLKKDSDNKYPINSQNNFMIEVFEMLELDFDDYITQGSMSYANLIDPTNQTRQSKSTNCFLKKISEDGLPIKSKDAVSDTDNDKAEEANEANEKEDNLGAEFNKTPFGKKDSSSKLKYNEYSAKNNNRRIRRISENSPFVMSSYQPDYLDDPQLTELTAGKNRTCLKFASYAVSIIDYVKPLDLKKEINETFKEKFPYIQISLTKLRSIKRELLEIAYETSLDIIIVAQSYIYFEKLILQGLINKANRKLLAANCLILASKLNDVTKKEINKLIDTIISKFRFDSRKEVISYEFPILVALEFNLMVKYENDFTSHYDRLMSNINYSKLNDSQQQAYLKSNFYNA